MGVVTFLAGLLFGYDQGGALPLLVQDLDLSTFGESTTFLFSALCIVSIVFVYRLVPETRAARSRRSRSAGCSAATE